MKRRILNESLLSSIRTSYVGTFIELFMGVKKEFKSEVTFSDFLSFVKNHDDSRGESVALFRRVISLIKKELENSGRKKEAHQLLLKYPHVA